MSTVNSATGSNASFISQLNAGASSSSSSSSSAATSADQMQTRFLNLLVTQLKNQDPLNPMDNTQMTTQLSQISTVSGIEKLNTTMQQLLSSYASTQNMQAAAMIGKAVLTAGSSMALGNNGAVGGFSLDSAADHVTVTIKDSAGRTVKTEQLGKHDAGAFNFTWDGTADDGTSLANGDYTFAVNATNGGTAVTSKTLQAGTVNAVTLASDGVTMQLDSGKNVAYSDIKQILN